MVPPVTLGCMAMRASHSVCVCISMACAVWVAHGPSGAAGAGAGSGSELATAPPPRPTYQSPELTPWPHPAIATNGTAALAIQVRRVELCLNWGGLSADFPSRCFLCVIICGAPTACMQSAALQITTASSSSVLRSALGRLLQGDHDGQLTCPSSPVPMPPGLRTVQQATLNVKVESDDEELGAETDESYVLTVSVDGAAAITAPTVFGALHGLQSLAQLFELPPPGTNSPPGTEPQRAARPSYLLRGLPWAIRDSPRFSHRAMLLDTSRHWLPLATIRQHIDGMEMNKLNVRVHARAKRPIHCTLHRSSRLKLRCSSWCPGLAGAPLAHRRLSGVPVRVPGDAEVDSGCLFSNGDLYH